MASHFDDPPGGHEDKKGGAAHKRSPPLNEPVGGRLIRVLYCRPDGKSFQFFGGAAKEKAKTGEDAHSSQKLTREMQAAILALGRRSATSSPQLGGCL
jgi:hypothetical protein